ncbi:tRNA (guanosine(46)-N7)-methyltransferase TrmB [Bacillus spongiae]|uniref:tRNA (guanine-N(7)-)-methyltransferase n=1 Tax=Bacillus spongiae TaxID=2683610 RepID=A0ABU8HI04_9BACI
MRLRHKPWAKEKLNSFPQYFISEPENNKGKWRELFQNDYPIHIEVGTGKGKFVTGMAKANPFINYIGIELYESVAVTALDRLIEAELPNLKLLSVDARNLCDFFAEGEIDRVYLNFSDPWPKSRHAKRRLTHEGFLRIYEEILVNEGEIHFKTDNQKLFEYSLQSFSAYGLRLNYVSLDLHKSDFEGNIMTEYEEKFSSIGQRIYRSEVRYLRKR